MHEVNNFIDAKTFIHYTREKIIDYFDEHLYRSYVCDGVKLLSELMARTEGGDYLTERYIDIIKDALNQKKKDAEEKKKTMEAVADNIILETMAKCGLTLKK